MEQNPIEEEPHEHVDEEEDQRLPAEQVADGPGGQGSDDETLGQRLEKDSVRQHRHTQLRPSGAHKRHFNLATLILIHKQYRVGL